MLYPLTFRPIFKERVWGGRKLEQLYRKQLPPHVPIGESWEVTDRPAEESVVAQGSIAGKTLRWVMEHHGPDLLGSAKSLGGRFPLLVKILDARETLSLQVHPPADLASKPGVEPKTEMWYVVHAEPGAELFAGLKRGVTPAEFEKKLADGTVASCFHRIPVRAGDAMFIPSGRVHAVGAGTVLFEIQQNSDTTYRVFDWNRLGLDGKPRQLHLAESLQCINYHDFEPGLIGSSFAGPPEAQVRTLVRDPLFEVELRTLSQGTTLSSQYDVPQIFAGISGTLEIIHPIQSVRLGPGEFCLVPSNLAVEVTAGHQSQFLTSRPR